MVFKKRFKLYLLLLLFSFVSCSDKPNIYYSIDVELKNCNYQEKNIDISLIGSVDYDDWRPLRGTLNLSNGAYIGTIKAKAFQCGINGGYIKQPDNHDISIDELPGLCSILSGGIISINDEKTVYYTSNDIVEITSSNDLYRRYKIVINVDNTK